MVRVEMELSNVSSMQFTLEQYNFKATATAMKMMAVMINLVMLYL
jgi:hypothetical protein